MDTWNADEIIVVVATSLDDDVPTQINLSDTIGFAKTRRNEGRSRYWLQQYLNQNDALFRQRHIVPIFVRACHAAGFLIKASYQRHAKCIKFRCKRSNYYKKADTTQRVRNVKDPSKPPVPRNRRSNLPVAGEEVTCKFLFRVYWDDRRQRWFLPIKQAGCLCHCGHVRENPESLRMMARHVLPPEPKAHRNAIADETNPYHEFMSMYKSSTGGGSNEKNFLPLSRVHGTGSESRGLRQ